MLARGSVIIVKQTKIVIISAADRAGSSVVHSMCTARHIRSSRTDNSEVESGEGALLYARTMPAKVAVERARVTLSVWIVAVFTGTSFNIIIIDSHAVMVAAEPAVRRARRRDQSTTHTIANDAARLGSRTRINLARA